MIPFEHYKVWVLAPQVMTQDANIDYYYDFSQSIAEYTKTFTELGIDWQWTPVTIHNFRSVIDAIEAEANSQQITPVIFNLCDGDEINETPGISVIKYLNEKGIWYTGSDEYFYRITTSKIPMKKAFDAYQVPTPAWIAIDNIQQNIHNIFSQLGKPVILKPAVSGGSMGVSIKNVVSNEQELQEQLHKMFEGYRGWKLAADGIIAEAFINGPEFTTLIVGSHDEPEKAMIFTPVERVFHASLPEHERFLSFDRLWEIYEEEAPMPNEENFYHYALPETSLHEQIKQLSWEAFVACKGRGYTRVDLRMDAESRKLYVLEVNAQCGISEDEDFTSIGAILRLSNVSFSSLVQAILNNANCEKNKVFN